MSQGSCLSIPRLLFVLNILGVAESFSATQRRTFSQKQFPFHTKGNAFSSNRHHSALALGLGPNDIINDLNHMQPENHIEKTANVKTLGLSEMGTGHISSPGSSMLIADSIFGSKKDAYPLGQTVKPTVSESFTASIRSDGESKGAVLPSDRQFSILDSGSVTEEPEYDERALEFYTKEAVAFAKLPLAAVIYATFEFFFMNQKRQQDMYYRYENDFDDEEEEAAQQMEFGGTLLLRIGAAFALTIVTLALS